MDLTDSLLCPCTFLALIAFLFVPVWIAPLCRALAWLCERLPMVAIVRAIENAWGLVEKLWDAEDGIIHDK